jgi:hypothetical protein
VADATNRGDSEPDFYVGYLPVPRAHRRFLRILVPSVLWALVGVALLVAASQPDPGPAVWSTGTPRAFNGVMLAAPYPMLYAEDRGDGRPGFLLLVEVGKRGAGSRVAPFNGVRVAISGWVLRREDRVMVELEPGESAIHAHTPLPAIPQISPPPPRRLGRLTLRGEIVDSKCYLGAMKPGDGRTHKECATLCVAGGIPPMLVTRDRRGVATCYLLMDPSGGPLDPAVRPFIADPVEITGDCDEYGGLRRLRVRVEDVHRL